MTTAGSLPVPHNWINDRFGSKRGLLKYSLFEAKRMAGLYSSIKIARNTQPERFVFVCVGNICRSPLAEAMAKSKGYNAISYGLDTRGDDYADPRAIAFAQKHKLNLAQHRTRKIEDYIEYEGDLIVGMEPGHLLSLKGKNYMSDVTLLGLYAPKAMAYIHDPYNTNSHYFSLCESTVIESTLSLLSHVG
ncbi:MAG: hypothetical protein ABJ000_07665 [Saccharospirillum sp.]|uniref:arsenate reductase/protein-tyrosine-phosphatase family protein n=1 Tax=Saccharospirillum sp. TaxID=2033801 RepID=UPI003297D14E